MLNEKYVLIGEGGFAKVYLEKNTGYVVKKLKQEYLRDENIKSRFKNEFKITKKLNRIVSIINVIDFDSNNFSYRMEKMDFTLQDFIYNSFSTIEDSFKIKLIEEIIFTMSEVHSKDIIHRDLSPTNIFIYNNSNIKIADFGLGKDLRILRSKETKNTNNFGQILYTAPEQTALLIDGSKKSDVYSLGKIINFIMTNNPNDISHKLGTISEKSTDDNPDNRFLDAVQMNEELQKIIKYYKNEERKKIALVKIQEGIYDTETEQFLLELSILEMNKILSFSLINALLKFMVKNTNYGLKKIRNIKDYILNVWGMKFEDYDVFANLAYEIIKNHNLSFIVKQEAIDILNHIAYTVGRFNAQGLIEKLKQENNEPDIINLLN